MVATRRFVRVHQPRIVVVHAFVADRRRLEPVVPVVGVLPGFLGVGEIPKIVPIVVDKPGLDVACGAIGIGEITSIPTAPAIADAYFRYDGERRTKLPLANTPYERKG